MRRQSGCSYAYKRSAFTLAELIAVMAMVGICIGLFLPMFAHNRRRGCTSTLRDSSQIRGIHQSWLVFADDAGGALPTPGLYQRQPVDGVITPGRGREDKLLNTTANLHALCIMQNFYSPEFCISPTEPSSKVFVKDDYNWENYDPRAEIYWDPSFKADLQKESNISYASMPIASERQESQWKNTLGGSFAVIGNRGVRNGTTDPIIHDSSITLKIHGNNSTWVGNVCFHDNHVEYLRGFYMPNVLYQNRSGTWQADNLFRNDNRGSPTATGVTGIDCWLAITTNLYGTPDEVSSLKNSWD